MTTRLTDEEVRAWAQRHDLQGSITNLRCAFEDSVTLRAALQSIAKQVNVPHSKPYSGHNTTPEAQRKNAEACGWNACREAMLSSSDIKKD